MFQFLKKFLPPLLGGEPVQENISKRKREDMNQQDGEDGLASGSRNLNKKTKPNLQQKSTTTTNKKKTIIAQQQSAAIPPESSSSTKTTTIQDLKKKQEPITPSHELVHFLKETQKLANDSNQTLSSRCNTRKKIKKAKSKVLSEKPILTDHEVIILDDDEDDLKHAYKKLDGNFVNEKYLQNHSEAIHPLNIHQKLNSDNIKIPHIPVVVDNQYDDDDDNKKKKPFTTTGTSTKNKEVSVEIPRVEPKPPKIISRKLFVSRYPSKDKGPTLFRGDQVDRLTSKLDSLLAIRDTSESRVTRSFIEREAINRASSRVLSVLCKELLGEEAKKLYDSVLPQTVYNRLVSEIIAETVASQKEKFPLSARDEKFVEEMFLPKYENSQQVISDKFSIDITRAKIQCLKGLKWLNDEVINFYFNMIKERSEKYPDKYPKVHVFNTFFYEKLAGKNHSSYNYSAVRRWTKKVDLLEYDKVIIPIHLAVHWTLAIINLRDNKFEYFDSMDGHSTGKIVLQHLERYLIDEIKDKKGVTYETHSWQKSFPPVPQQENGSDCGVFACKFANYASQDLPFTFEQKDMRYFRDRMVLEIVRAKEIL